MDDSQEYLLIIDVLQAHQLNPSRLLLVGLLEKLICTDLSTRCIQSISYNGVPYALYASELPSMLSTNS